MNEFSTYLIENHKTTLLNIMKNELIYNHYSININFLHFFETLTDFANKLFTEPKPTLDICSKSVQLAQDVILTENENSSSEVTLFKKEFVHIRMYDLPACPELHRNIFPKNCDLGYFLQVSGTVVRTTSVQMLECKRIFQCTKCKYEIVIEGEYERKFLICNPIFCTNPNGCNSSYFKKVENVLNSSLCKDYQEIKIQERVQHLKIGSIPSSMWVTLEDDLADSCKPGDDVSICGTVMWRWGALIAGKRTEIEIVLKANHIEICNEQKYTTKITPEIQKQFDQFWEKYQNEPLLGRNVILNSFCPQIFGMSLVKLAICLIVAGGSNESTDARIRCEPHLLLVGDPGTGKSQLLRWAANCVPRSVLTTGIGSTAAGLTVTAVQEGGQWQLEAGALVLADGGICCIDEFNSMKPHDRASIHEAMEQQTISVAKASMVCKLSTKCSILAAANFKGAFNPNEPLVNSIAIAPPLLSRFDLVLILRDLPNQQWDQLVTDYILNSHILTNNQNDKELWNLEKLQAYFILIKRLNPKLTPGANEILRNYYQYERQSSQRNAARTTVRLLDSLIRLCQAHARLMYRNQVEVTDAIMAIYLTECTTNFNSTNDLNSTVIFRNQFENPTIEYIQIAQQLFKKLNLNHILNEEMEHYKKILMNQVNFNDSANISIKLD